MGQVLFTNVKVLDGSGTAPFAGEVLVEGNRIRRVARGEAVSAPGTEVIDGGGGTLMPGMVEAHAHPTYTDTASLEALGDIPPEDHVVLSLLNARKMLDQGFTSLCSAAAAKPRLDVTLRNAIDSGHFPGPRMLAASPEMTVTAGLGDVRLRHMHRETFAVICDGADEFRKVSREMVREGVDTLKINPSGDEFVPHCKANMTVMSEAEIAAVCEVARAFGKRVASHARSAESVKLSVKHGVEVIYHATLADEEALDALESAKDWCFVAPAIGITHTTLFEAGAWGIRQDSPVGHGLKLELEAAQRSIKELKRRGLRILIGGDYGFAWNPIGTNARDVEHFVTYFGYTPLEAIEAATRLGGQIMGMGDELGMIREGWLADLLLVDGDPSRNVKLLQDADRFLAIMKDGAFHKRPAEAAQARRQAAE